MARCLFSLLPSSLQLEVVPHLIRDQHLVALPIGISMQDATHLAPEQKIVFDLALKEFFKVKPSSFSKNDLIQKLEIPSKSALDFFQKTASQGMLGFDGKKIFFDPFVDWDLEIEVLEEETALFVDAFLRLNSLRIPLKEIQWSFVEKRGWVLYRDTLRPLNANYDPRLLKKIFSQGALWSKEEKEFFLENDPEGPKITCLFEEKKAKERKAILQDLFGMELFLSPPLPQEFESELKQAGYQKRREDLFVCSSAKALGALELLITAGWSFSNRRGKKIIPLTKCYVLAEEIPQDSSLVIHADLEFEGTKKQWKELTFEGPMLVSLSKDSLGLVLPKQLPSYLRDPQFRLRPTEPIQIKSSRFGELEGIDLPQAFQKLLGTSIEKDVVPGSHFSGKLFPYQQRGLEWISSLRDCHLNGLLADEMGLGKTVQVISFLSLPKTSPALIVVPASLVVQWKREIEKFLPGSSVFIYEGDSDSLKTISSESICIVSFGMIRREKELFSSKSWATLILDEAHSILNQKTQLFEALNSIKASFRLAMTGTPLINRQQDFESLFMFLVPNLLEKGLEPHKIKMRTAPLILRRTQAEVFDELPERIEEEVLVELTPSQWEHYEQLKKGIIETESHSKKSMEVLEVILRLRQVCLHPALVHLKKGAILSDELFDLELSSKFSLLLLDLEEMIEGKKKAIVCSSFAKALRLLQKLLPFRQEQILILDGETTHRSDIVEEFETSQEGTILLLSLKAGGVGLNLPSADAFFLLDPWWNEAIEEQAVYRALRLGRKKKLIVKKYIAMGTVEEKIKLLKKSKKLEEAMLLGDQMELSEDLLLGLFEP